MGKKKNNLVKLKNIPWKIIKMYVEQEGLENRRKLKYFIKQKVKKIIRFRKSLAPVQDMAERQINVSASVNLIRSVKISAILLEEIQTDDKNRRALHYETTGD